MKIQRALLTVVVALVPALAIADPNPPPLLPWENSPVIVITLRSSVSVDRSLAQLQDIATLAGGSFHNRKQVAALDMIDLPALGDEMTITREQVMYRLLVAGLSAHRFRLEGSLSTIVRREKLNPIQQVSAVGGSPGNGIVVASLQRAPATPLPPLIKKRDIVRLDCTIGNLKVTARGEALEDGVIGQTIRLRNIDSSHTIMGRVVDRTTVEVDPERNRP